MIKTRVFEADFLRGVAIVLMVIFHLCFDLNYFKYISIDIYSAIEWKVFRAIIVFLFLLIVGVSMFFAYSDGINYKKFKKRIFILLGSSLLITIVTMLTFPKSWIYFGIIHFILVATILGLPFVRYPNISLVVGIIIIIGYFLGFLPVSWIHDMLKPILGLPSRTEDIVKFFPWFGVVLIGIFVGSKKLFYIKITQNIITNKIALFGRHALIIYLIHQPILFGSIMLHRLFFPDVSL